MTTTITWTGKSGTVFTFELYPFEQLFNAVPGIYIACKPLQSAESYAFSWA